MYYEIDYKEAAAKAEVLSEIYEFLHVKIYEHMKDKVDPKLVLGQRLAWLWEPYDSGPKTSWDSALEWNLIEPRCERGYYADFYVCSTLNDFSAMIIHAKGIDAIQIVNVDEETF